MHMASPWRPQRLAQSPICQAVDIVSPHGKNVFRCDLLFNTSILYPAQNLRRGRRLFRDNAGVPPDYQHGTFRRDDVISGAVP